ncbi:hypothetical protein CFK37_15900 [Virgibacillus phasianinus]|uniref:Uncharacterized protein n=1 Tax=Virgibacillus phasianinus TaxID=2017483 RepID=A0A220U6R3_9BACI|nr:hypothetical protein [Virgibacillus phasianinus]ASK63531.1 hypothetical protein CFK37_15900 [Virgibacillus phasianinus]
MSNHVSALYGYFNAKNTDEFLVFKNNSKEDFVVIDNIGDKFITAPIDLTTNEIEKKYLVIEQKSDIENPLIFEKVKIEGGIKVKDGG